METCVQSLRSSVNPDVSRNKSKRPISSRSRFRADVIENDGVRLILDQHDRHSGFCQPRERSKVQLTYNDWTRYARQAFLTRKFVKNAKTRSRFIESFQLSRTVRQSVYCNTTVFWIGCCLRGFQALVRRAYFRTGDRSIRCFSIGPVILFLSY